MVNRTRKSRIVVPVTDEEKCIINSKMEQANIESISMYARKMLIDGYVIKQDYQAIKELTREINAIGNNVNQIARRMNETRSVYNDDVNEVIEMQKEIALRLREILLDRM